MAANHPLDLGTIDLGPDMRDPDTVEDPAMSTPAPSNEAELEAGFTGAHGSADVPDFISELRNLINKHSMENASNTPDFILAQYLTNCLRAWNQATQRRETWYGRDARPTSPPNSRIEQQAALAPEQRL